MSVEVYFNPECSKCRTVRSILEGRGVEPEYVRYLEQAPTREQLEKVMQQLGADDPREMMRTQEQLYDELGLASATHDELLDAMTAYPVLVIRGSITKKIYLWLHPHKIEARVGQGSLSLG